MNRAEVKKLGILKEKKKRQEKKGDKMERKRENKDWNYRKRYKGEKKIKGSRKR